MSDSPITTSGASPIKPGVTPQDQTVYIMEQLESEEAYMGTEDAAFSPFVLAQRAQSLEARRGKKAGEAEKTEKEELKIEQIEQLEAVAERYETDNAELESASLLLLRTRLAKGDSKNDILGKVLSIYADYALADQAIDFLLETADAEMKEAIQEAKEEINTKYGREIRAGRNIGEQARAFSKEGLGSPTALRDLYRDITGNPRETTTLFDELNDKFTQEQMGTVIEFLLHSLGSDLKSKGPSIRKGELHRLMTETRALQAILGLYRFFQSRMRLIFKGFQRYGMALPSRLTYIALAKQFIKLLQDRYPNVDKILQLGAEFGLVDALDAQTIIYSQYRDGLKQVAPRLFRSEKHKNDLSMMLAVVLDRLHKQIEDQEEEKEKNKKE